MENPVQKILNNLGNTRPWDFLNPNVKYATDEVATSRYEICKVCPEFITLTKQCKKCGCFMAAKTRLESAACPIGKW